MLDWLTSWNYDLKPARLDNPWIFAEVHACDTHIAELEVGGPRAKKIKSNSLTWKCKMAPWK